MASWISIPPDSDFSLRNIPFGIFSDPPLKARPRCCTAIGNHVVDLSVLAEAGLFDDVPDFSPRAFSNATLNDFVAYPKPVWVNVRNRIIFLFSKANRLSTNPALQKACLHDISQVTMHMPVEVPDYTDFYSSRDHATNVGIMFRGKENALQPNWLHLPVGYHGRSSTILPSGTPIRRPSGQLQKDKDDPKQGSVYGACKLLDFELEMSLVVGGPANHLGEALSIEEANNRIFGFTLMNDWSARDVQKFEYVPLGPFTAKNFATTVSPWIVTTMALEEFRCPTSAQTQDDPTPLEYLQDPNYSSFNVNLQVAIQGDGMDEAEVVCESNFANLYWNATQQLVHHSVTGCVMRPGDMLGSGTISGSTESSFGSMLELCWKGTREVPLGSSGQVRKFLRDGDTVVMKGWAVSKDAASGRVGFGECSGKVLPALKEGEKVDVPSVIPLSGEERYQDFQLYGYWKSSATWRVRIALQAKSIPYGVIPVNLKEGEQKALPYLEKNPMAQVPVLEYTDAVTGKTVYLSQSIAIVEFLEEAFPKRPALLPVDPEDRAVAREMVELINSGTQPLQNMPMVRRLESMSQGTINGIEWGKEAIEKGLRALEVLVVERHIGGGGPFALGGFAPSLVDACVVPQLFNAGLFGVNTAETCPTLHAIGQLCAKHHWFEPAHPSAQPDAES